MANVTVTNTRAITLATRLTVADLRTLIEGVDGSCAVRITQSGGGNQMDPRTTSITIVDVKPERITRAPAGGRPMDTL